MDILIRIHNWLLHKEEGGKKGEKDKIGYA